MQSRDVNKEEKGVMEKRGYEKRDIERYYDKSKIWQMKAI